MEEATMAKMYQQWVQEGVITGEMVDEALNTFERELDRIKSLAESGQCWEAYANLTSYVSLLNAGAQQQPSKQPGIIGRLLGWIHKIKGVLDTIVRGIGGNGYSIGVSVPWGVSISVSFPA